MIETILVLMLLLAASLLLLIWVRGSNNTELENIKSQLDSKQKACLNTFDKLQKAHDRILELEEAGRKFNALNGFVSETLIDWKKQSALLPSLREWSDRIQVEYDQLILRDLLPRRSSGKSAAEQIKEARSLVREYKKELELLRPQLALYESLAPWLSEYTDLTVEEILEGLKEENFLKDFYKCGDDPVTLFVPRSEWTSLTESERNQLALDRYWKGSRRRSAWTAGIQYERYIGYHHEAKGYSVNYHGAKNGVADLGIDLVCVKNEETRIVQCKRLSPIKGIPVRENVIAQVYGSARYYTMMQSHLTNAIPVLYTSYECSETAREFAKLLGVRLFENVQFKPYPSIKCNISKATGERIYHLPFDQKYDETIIGDNEGEFYAMSVIEAESAGFRRAFRWSNRV